MSFQQTVIAAVAFGRSIKPRPCPMAGALTAGLLIGAVLAGSAQAETEPADPRVIKAPEPAVAQLARTGDASSPAKTSETKKSAPVPKSKPAKASEKIPEPKSAAHSLAAAPSGDWSLCRQAAAKVGPRISAPKYLLSAVTLTETGRGGPGGKSLMAWPWTINVGGKGYVFTTKNEAVRAVRRLLSQGYRSIDVGCMQVNLKYHPRAFTSLEEAFDPAANLAYGAEFLVRLKKRHGTWDLAVQHYHSFTKEFREQYASRFKSLWALERRRMAEATRQRTVGGSAALASGVHARKTHLLEQLPQVPLALIRTALPNLDPLRRLEPVTALMTFGENLAALEPAVGDGQHFLQRLTGTYPEVAEPRMRSASLSLPVSLN